MLSITKEFTFEASHVLPWHEGKCSRLHGHSYRLEVSVVGPLNENGVIMDFADLKKAVKELVIHHLDHRHLNDLIPNPTGENIAQWIWDQLTAWTLLNAATGNNPYVQLKSVKLWETATAHITIERK